VIFDGYPAPSFKFGYDYSDIDAIFSKGITADEKIKVMLEKATNCRVIVVVSDDRQIKFFAKACRAKAIGVEEFVKSAIPDVNGLSHKGKLKTQKSNLVKPELTYVQIDKINKELKKLWLK
jgi:predicted RNA-binding protein with PIN domain